MNNTADCLKQGDIARETGTTQGFVSQVLSGKKRPSWEVAKLFAAAVPGTTPAFWMESTKEERKAAVREYQKRQCMAA